MILVAFGARLVVLCDIPPYSCDLGTEPGDGWSCDINNGTFFACYSK